MKRITGCQMHQYVEKLTQFDNSKGSCYARWANVQIRHYDEKGEDTHEDTYERLYVVYSYGSHFPMLIYSEDAKQWFGNSTRWSKTTSKHFSQACPRNANVTFLDNEDMKLCVSKGVGWLVRWRMAADNGEEYGSIYRPNRESLRSAHCS